MRKYLQILKINFQQEFAYRLNFIMWRVRNVIQIFLIFFLWSSIFYDTNRVVFGYDRSKILTYVFGTLVIKAVVFSSRSVDLSTIIADGSLSNYLLKPVNFFKYWFVRDVSSKLLNLFFALFETLFLFLILKPEIFIQTNPLYIFLFLLSLVIAVLLFFVIVFVINMFSFWSPETNWALPFLFIVIIADLFSGSVFPLDIFPQTLQNIFYSLPFSYLVFFPLQVYLGKLSLGTILNGIFISLGWLIIFSVLVKTLWDKGLKEYKSEGI